MAQTGPNQGVDAAIDIPRRRFLAHAGAAIAAFPVLAGLADRLGSPLTTVQPSPDASAKATANPWPPYPAYKFAMICRQTSAPLFVPTILGANDACALLGTSYTWDGSTSGDVEDMADAFQDALDNRVSGIACCIVDPKRFNGLTNQALDNGIPVIAFNAEAPVGSGNHAMAYIGQDHEAAGTALAERALEHVKKGDLVGGMVATPSSFTEKARMEGAAGVFKAAGVEFEEVVVGTDIARATANIERWYRRHRHARFIFTSSSDNGQAVADAVRALGLSERGATGATFDVTGPVLSAIKDKDLAFAIDQQPYLQGFLSILELFLYNITGGLVVPFDVATGTKFVDAHNVAEYISHRDSWEGSGTRPVVLSPPKKIHIP